MDFMVWLPHLSSEPIAAFSASASHDPKFAPRRPHRRSALSLPLGSKGVADQQPKLGCGGLPSGRVCTHLLRGRLSAVPSRRRERGKPESIPERSPLAPAHTHFVAAPGIA